MKALVKTRPGPGLELIDVPVPAVEAGDVLVKISSKELRYVVRQCAHNGRIGMLVRFLVAADCHVHSWRQCVEPGRVAVAVKRAVYRTVVRHFEDTRRARQARRQRRPDAAHF